MADVNARIGIDVDASSALAQLKQLQRQISLFHTNMVKGGAAAAQEAQNLQRNLVNSINSTGQFSASMTRIATTTESFTSALEKNKFSMGEYFRYAGASTKTFGKLFTTEFNTINKVARERVKDLQTQYIKMGRDANGAMQAIRVRPLTLDLKDLGTQTAIAAQKQQLFNQLIKQGSTNLLNWGKNTQWAGRQLMVGFTIPLTIFGATATREFAKLEEQAIRFKRVYGDMFTSEGEVEKAISDIKQLAAEFTKYGIAVEKTVDLAASVAQMGAMGEDLKRQVTEATRLAVLGGIEQQEALNTTISLTNAFGLATEQLSGKIAFLNAAENQTILSIEDFNEAIPKAGSVVKQLGGDVEDLAYFLTAMREGGVTASQAANALKSSLARLINPTEVAKKELAGFGIDILGIVEGNAGNLRATIQVLAQELDKLDPLNKSRAIEQLFGKFQFARMSTLFENIVRDGSQANKVLELTTYNSRELGVIADRELARVEGSPLYKFRKTLEEFQAALAPIGEQFIKLVTPLVEFGTKVLERFNGMSDGAKMFVTGLTAAVGIVAPAALMLVGLLANAIANLLLFGNKISSVFNKSASSSNVLAEQLNYMNSEQIQSAAVAASLDQVHQTLIQTFNAEAGAISNLSSAYQRATEAQRQYLISQGLMSGPAPGPARPAPKPSTNPFMPPKFAKGGIIRGPGSGTSDSIPALVSNGEFIVSAERTKQYLPFLKAIGDGTLPKFASPDGASLVGPSVLGRTTQRSFMHQDPGFSMPVSVAQGVAGPIGEVARALVLLGETSRSTAVQAEMAAKTIETKSLWGVMGDQTLNDKSVTGALLSDLRTDIGSGTAQENWSQGIVGGGGDPQELSADMENYNAEYLRQIDAAKDKGVQYFTDTEANLEKARQRLGDLFDPNEWISQETLDNRTAAAEAARGSRIPAVRDVAKTSPREGRTYTVSREAFDEAIDHPDPRIREPFRKKLSRFKDGIWKPASASMTASKQAKKDLNEIIKSGKLNGEAYNDGLETTVKDAKDVGSEKAGRNSPHPEAFQDGVDDAQAYNKGQRSVISGKSDPYALGGKLAPPAPPSVVPQQSTSGGFRGMMRGVAEKAAYSKPGVAFATYLAKKSGNTLTDESGKILYDAATEQKKSATETRRAAKELNQGAQELEQGSQVLEGAANNIQNSTNQRNTNVVAGGGTGKKAGGKTSMGFGGKAGISMGLSALTMGASMAPGAVGEQAQKYMPQLMMLSTMPMLLDALKNPLVAVLAVVASLAVGIFMLNNKFKEAQKEAYEMGKAIGASKDAMRGLSEFAGTVSSGEYMDKVRQERMSGVTTAPGKTTFGESFVNNETGQALIEAAKMTVAETGNSQMAISQLTSQLSTGVISGAITREQASSIASNIGLALGDMNLAFEVRANISELVGPSGEDITGGDIVELSAKLNAANLDNIGDQINMLNKNVGGMAFGTQTQRNVGMTGMVAAGAGVGAAVGALAGPIGALIGMGIGAGVGAFTGFKTMGEQAEKAGALSGAVVATVTNALEQQQEMSDALDAYYLKKIEEAKIQGDITEQLRLQAEYEGKKVELSEQEIAMREQLRGALQGPGADAARTGIEAAVETRFKDDASAQLLLPGIRSTMDRVGIKGADKDSIELELATGAISPAALNSLLTFIGEDEGKKTALLDIIGKFGGVFADESSQVMSLIDDEDLASSIFVDISTAGNEQEAQDILDFVREIQQQDAVFDTDIILNYMQQNQDVADDLQAIFDRADMGVATVEQAYEINPKLADPEAFDEEYFNMLPDADKEQYVKTVSMILEMDEAKLTASPDFEKWLGDEGQKFGAYPGSHSISWWQKRYAEDMGQKVTTQLSSVDTTTEPGDVETPSGGGGPKGSWLDPIVKQVRDFNVAQQELTTGFDDSLAALVKFSEAGVQGFGGLSNQLRSIGVGEPLIEKILGMSAEEWAEQKDQLFKFDVAGNIIGLTAQAQAIQDALNTAVIGQFIAEQDSVTVSVGNQITALDKLTGAGASYEAAYRAVQNTALASAIATAKSSREIQAAAEAAMKAQEQMDKFQEINEEEMRRKRIADAIKEQNKEFNNQSKILNYINKNRSKLSEAQIESILSNKDLQALILEPNIAPGALQTALDNANKQAELELKIKKLTVSGQQEIFETGLNNAMDSFSAQEKQIDIAFNAVAASDQDAVKAAEEEIAKLDFQLDDYNAGLKEIEYQEDVINKAYEKRFEALDRIAEANADITRQQQSQLDIADALSRGDIAAAARAVQEARSAEAEKSATDERARLEKAQASQIAALRSGGGLNREELQDKVREIEEQIFRIEEDRLEPAQEALRLLELQKEADIEGLMVLGKTREEWDKIANQVDIARVNNYKFVNSMREGLDIVDKLIAGYQELPKEVVEALVTSSGGGGGGGKKSSSDPAPAPAPAKSGGTGGTPTTKDLPSDYGTGAKLMDPNYVQPKSIMDMARDRDPELARVLAQSDQVKKDINSSWQMAVLRGLDIVTRPIQVFAEQTKNLFTGKAAEILFPKPAPAAASTTPSANAQSAQSRSSKSSSSSSSAPSKPASTPAAPKPAPRPKLTASSPQVKQAIALSDKFAKMGRAKSMGGFIRKAYAGPPQQFASGGLVSNFLSTMASGGFYMGSDSIPALLTPGEFVIKRPAVQGFGVKNLEKINNGENVGGSVYNYNLAVNVKSDSDPNQIARTVMSSIRQVESKRIRGNRF